ncbi:MAG TPA: Ig-like domain-containing protein [Polyangiaceae bacterium]|nr:Ig-like domain-containing protein [Polyangiaceae bacterium]
MTRTMSSSIIASCLLLAACGGGSGADAGADGPAADPTNDPTSTMEDDDTSAADGGAPASSSGDAGSASDEPEEDPVDDPVPDPTDDEAPTIVQTWPEAGASGVLTDETIALEFSEPMDREATEAAFTSAELPSDAVTFSWNSDSTLLTITPNDPLEYAVGLDPATLVAKTYSYVLETGATDVAGNALADDFASSFDTARMLLAEGPLVPGYSGSLNMESGAVGVTLESGDLTSKDMIRTFVTFTLPELAADPLELLVILETAQIGVSGAPFTDLISGGQELLIAPASFSTADEVQALEMSAPLANLSNEPALGQRTLDLTNHVADLYANDANSAQFIIQFPTDTDGDAIEDSVLFDHNSTRLAIAYLLP